MTSSMVLYSIVTIFSNSIISHIEKDIIIVSIVNVKILNCMNIIVIVIKIHEFKNIKTIIYMYVRSSTQITLVYLQ